MKLILKKDGLMRLVVTGHFQPSPEYTKLVVKPKYCFLCRMLPGKMPGQCCQGQAHIVFKGPWKPSYLDLLWVGLLWDIDKWVLQWLWRCWQIVSWKIGPNHDWVRARIPVSLWDGDDAGREEGGHFQEGSSDTEWEGASNPTNIAPFWICCFPRV